MTGSGDLTLIAGQIATIVNGADLAGAPSPGSLATIFGGNLASTAAGATTVPLPLSISGASVTANGISAPMWYAGPQRISLQMPADAAPGNATAVVTSDGIPTAPFAFTLAQAAPGVFTYGGNRAVAVNPDNSLIDASHPAAPGSVITVYLTGIGSLDNPVPTNTPAQPLSRPTLPASATIGGQNAPVQDLGLTPGAIALAQAGIAAPNLSPGDYPVVITIGGVASATAPLIAVSSR